MDVENEKEIEKLKQEIAGLRQQMHNLEIAQHLDQKGLDDHKERFGDLKERVIRLENVRMNIPSQPPEAAPSGRQTP